MEEDEKKENYWFKRRRYGYGWIPVAWQGWAVIAVYIVIIFLAGWMIKDVQQDTINLEIALFWLTFVLATISLVRISYKKGPKPKWRWGKSEDDNPKKDF